MLDNFDYAIVLCAVVAATGSAILIGLRWPAARVGGRPIEWDEAAES